MKIEPKPEQKRHFRGKILAPAATHLRKSRGHDAAGPAYEFYIYQLKQDVIELNALEANRTRSRVHFHNKFQCDLNRVHAISVLLRNSPRKHVDRHRATARRRAVRNVFFILYTNGPSASLNVVEGGGHEFAAGSKRHRSSAPPGLDKRTARVVGGPPASATLCLLLHRGLGPRKAMDPLITQREPPTWEALEEAVRQILAECGTDAVRQQRRHRVVCIHQNNCHPDL